MRSPQTASESVWWCVLLVFFVCVLPVRSRRQGLSFLLELNTFRRQVLKDTESLLQIQSAASWELGGWGGGTGVQWEGLTMVAAFSRPEGCFCFRDVCYWL